MGDRVDRAEVFGETAEAAERIAPGFMPDDLVAEHVARYSWAAAYVRGLDVLDAASGVGYGAEVLRGAGARSVTSLDASAPALRFGRDRYRLAPVQADAAAFPFGAESFDAVVSLETIEHVAHTSAFLAEVARVLRPRGTLLLSSPNRERSKGGNPYHVNELTYAELADHLDGAGFRIERVRGQHWDVLGGLLWKLRGVARLARRLDRTPRVGRMPLPASTPEVFCVRATIVTRRRHSDDT